VHVPALVAVSVVPSKAQPVAVPFATDAIERAPVEEPPVTELTVKDVCEYGNALLIALSTGNEIDV
jgi:hypothetical protein